MTGPAPTLPLAATAGAGVVRADAERISPWLEFADPALERAFREASLGNWAHRLRITSIIAPILSLGFSYVDYKAFGLTSALALMWSVRLALVTTGFGIVWALRRPASVRAHDAAALSLTTVVSLLIFTMVFLQRRGAGETPATLLCALSFY